MSIASFHVFQAIYTRFSIGLAGAGAAGISHVYYAAQKPFAAALILWVIIQGYMVLNGRMDQDRALGKIITLAIVVTLVSSAAAYNTYIAQFFTTDLPNFIGQTFTGTNAKSFAAQFDIMENQFTAAGLIAYKQSRGIVGPAILSMQLYFIQAIFTIALGMMFAVYIASQILTLLMVEIGVFMLPLFLWDRTQGIAERWLGKMIGLAILLLLITSALSMLVTGCLAFIGTEFTATYGELSIQQELIVMMMVLAFVAVMAFITFILWPTATYLGGGVAMDISPIVTPWRA